MLFTWPACDDGGFGKRLRLAWLLAPPSSGCPRRKMMRFFKTAAIILVTLAGSFGASQLASGTPLSAGALPLSENVDMSMISKSRWRGGGYRGTWCYRGYRGGYRGYRGGYRGYRGGYRGYRGVRAYGYRYGYRPYRRYGAVGAAVGYGGCGPYSYYDLYSGVCRPSGGYYGARGVYGARVYRGRGYAYRGYRGGYRGGVYRGRAVAVRGGYGRGFARGRR